MSHTNSHTMEDHSETISEPPPPIRIDDGELNPTYDPSLDLAEFGPVISQIGYLHDSVIVQTCQISAHTHSTIRTVIRIYA